MGTRILLLRLIKVEGYTCAAMLCYAMDTALCLTWDWDWERRTERDVLLALDCGIRDDPVRTYTWLVG
jgi:hypothetical protein